MLAGFTLPLHLSDDPPHPGLQYEQNVLLKGVTSSPGQARMPRTSIISPFQEPFRKFLPYILHLIISRVVLFSLTVKRSISELCPFQLRIAPGF